MNKKQIIVIVLGVIALGLIVLLTPRYKITWIGSNSFIKTEQSSSLYKKSSGEVKFKWKKISFYSGIAIVTCGILLLLLKDKNGKTNS